MPTAREGRQPPPCPREGKGRRGNESCESNARGQLKGDHRHLSVACHSEHKALAKQRLQTQQPRRASQVSQVKQILGGSGEPGGSRGSSSAACPVANKKECGPRAARSCDFLEAFHNSTLPYSIHPNPYVSEPFWISMLCGPNATSP